MLPPCLDGDNNMRGGGILGNPQRPARGERQARRNMLQGHVLPSLPQSYCLGHFEGGPKIFASAMHVA